MSSLLYLAIGIAAIFVVMIFLLFTGDKRKVQHKPHLLSLVALNLIILTWCFYLFDFYTNTSASLGELVIHINILPIWVVVSIIGFIAAFKDFNNNRAYAIVNGGLATINTIIGMLAWGIGNM